MKVKYRVWNGERYITDLDYYILGIDTEGNAFYIYPNPESDFKEIIENVSIEFWTGLKDRNDKDIYEGDIVRLLYTDWPSKTSDDPRTIEQYMIDISNEYEVVYEINQFCVKGKDRYGDDAFGSILPGAHGYIEVIKNIHEK